MRLILEPVIDRYDDKELLQLYDPEKKEDFLNNLYSRFLSSRLPFINFQDKFLDDERYSIFDKKRINEI